MPLLPRPSEEGCLASAFAPGDMENIVAISMGEAAQEFAHGRWRKYAYEIGGGGGGVGGGGGGLWAGARRLV